MISIETRSVSFNEKVENKINQSHKMVHLMTLIKVSTFHNQVDNSYLYLVPGVSDTTSGRFLFAILSNKIGEKSDDGNEKEKKKRRCFCFVLP
jgi:hypothetical protein